MTANATAVSPAKGSAATQPPASSVWIRYHPWIEGVMAHISAWSIHLLVLGAAVLWFTYLAYALGFDRPLRSLPVEPVRIEPAGGNQTQVARSDNDGKGAAPKEASGTSSLEELKPIRQDDRPELGPIKPMVTPLDFPSSDDRPVKHDMEQIKKLAQLTNDVQKKLRIGLDDRKSQAQTGTDGGQGPGPGSGPGPKAGAEGPITKSEKRMLRWSIKFTTHDPKDYLRQLQALGAVLAIQKDANSFEVVDLTKRPFKPEVKDLSTIQRIWWIDDDPKSVQGLLAALRLPSRADRVIAFIPKEVEEELAKKELAYRGLDENDIFETIFGIEAPGATGRRYDVRVIEQKQKAK